MSTEETTALEPTRTKSKQAIDGKRVPGFELDPWRVMIELDEGHPLYGCQNSPLYDQGVDTPLELLEHMIADMVEFGFEKTTIVVKKDGPGRLIVIDGRTRVRALREANRRILELNARLPEDQRRPLLTVYCLSPENVTEAEALMTSVRLNYMRQDRDPVQMARTARNLVAARFGKNDIVRAMHLKSPTALDNLLALLKCSEPIREAVSRHEISASAAQVLSVLPVKQQEAKLEEIRALSAGGAKATVKNVRAVVAGGGGVKLKKGLTRVEIREMLDYTEITNDPKVQCLLLLVLGEATPKERAKLKGFVPVQFLNLEPVAEVSPLQLKIV